MKKIAIFGIILIGLFSISVQAFEWETNLEKTLSEAKETGKYILMDFTGSDWCGWCIKLDKEVFSKDDFKQFAEKHFVCIMVDFPRNKTQTNELKDQNNKLSKKYKIRGFPTIIILDPQGDFVAQTGYRKGGAKKYIEHLNKIVETYKDSTKK